MNGWPELGSAAWLSGRRVCLDETYKTISFMATYRFLVHKLSYNHRSGSSSMNPCGNDLEADPASKIAGIVRGLNRGSCACPVRHLRFCLPRSSLE